jgi:hypothetical protein
MKKKASSRQSCWLQTRFVVSVQVSGVLNTRFIGLIGLIRSIGSLKANPFNQ